MDHLTIKDIARLSGSSVSTVSRVLNNHPDVSEPMRRRVMEVVGDNHFVPNNSARNLVIRESDLIAVVVRGIGNPFFSRVIKTAESAIYQRGYSMSLHQIGSSEDEVMTAALLEREKRLRGILFLGGRFNYSPDEVAMIHVPFVCCTYTNTFGGLDRSKYSSVAIDDRAEACRAVSHLLDHGHRRVAALIERRDGSSISQLRCEGYLQALRERGITPEERMIECAGSFSMGDAYAATQRLLNRESFTALFVISDSMAMAAMKALYDGGKKIPDDCSVIAIDGIEHTNYCIPTLTTLEQPADELALESVAILSAMLDESACHRHLFMNTRLREGGSVATARAE